MLSWHVWQRQRQDYIMLELPLEYTLQPKAVVGDFFESTTWFPRDKTIVMAMLSNAGIKQFKGDLEFLLKG